MDENKKKATGLINEDVLKELTETEAPEGGVVLEITCAVTALLSDAFCPTLKCTSAC